MKIVVFIILICCTAGCRDTHELPPGILKSEKMQAVLWDVLLAESYSTEFIKKDSSKNVQVENAKLQQQIFAIHKISKQEFYDSYNYYNSHTELMKTLLDSITTRGEKEKERTLYSKPVIPVRKPFSLMPSPIPTPPRLVIIPMPIPKEITDQDSVPVENSRPIQDHRPIQNSRPVFKLNPKPRPIP